MTHPRRQIFGAVVGTLLGVVVVSVLWLLVQTYAVSAATRDTQKTNRDTFTTIEDCTTPGRSCFEDAMKRQRAAIEDVNRVSIVAAACADRDDTQTVREIQACVLAALKPE